MNARILPLLLLLAVAASGCASGPKYDEVTTRIPPIPDGQGRIYFYRPSVIGAAVQPSVRLDDEVVGTAVPRGFFFIDAAPGDHVVACSTESEHRLSFTLAASQERHVKLLMQMGLMVGHVVPVLVDPAEALEDLASTRFTGPEDRLLAEVLPAEVPPVPPGEAGRAAVAP